MVMSVSIEALAMAGANYIECGIDTEQWEREDLAELPPPHLLAEEEDDEEAAAAALKLVVEKEEEIERRGGGGGGISKEQTQTRWDFLFVNDEDDDDDDDDEWIGIGCLVAALGLYMMREKRRLMKSLASS